MNQVRCWSVMRGSLTAGLLLKAHCQLLWKVTQSHAYDLGTRGCPGTGSAGSMPCRNSHATPPFALGAQKTSANILNFLEEWGKYQIYATSWSNWVITLTISNLSLIHYCKRTMLFVLLFFTHDSIPWIWRRRLRYHTWNIVRHLMIVEYQTKGFIS